MADTADTRPTGSSDDAADHRHASSRAVTTAASRRPRVRALRAAALLAPVVVIGFVVWRFFPRSEELPPATPGVAEGTDEDGDPLPPFALRRYGSKRLRPGEATIALAPDGATLYSGHADGLVRVWEVATGRVVRTIEAHLDHVRPRGASPKELVRSILHPGPGGPVWVENLRVSPDGRLLATASGPCVRVFDSATGERRAEWVAHERWLTLVGFRADSASLVFVSDADVWVWEIGADGRAAHDPAPPRRGMLTGIPWSTDARFATAAILDPTRRASRLYDTVRNTNSEFATADDALMLAFPAPAGADGDVQVAWLRRRDPSDTTHVTLASALTNAVTAEAALDGVRPDDVWWRADGRRLIAAGRGRVTAIDARDGRVLWESQGARADWRPPVWRGPSLALSICGVLRMVDSESFAVVSPARPGDAFTLAAWSPADDTLALAGPDASVTIVDGPTGSRRRVSASDLPRPSARLAFAPDGRSVLECGEERALRHVVDGGPAEPVASVRGGAPLRSDSGGATALVASDSRPPQLVAPDGTARDLAGIRGPLVTWSLSADGRRLAGVDDCGALFVWDTATRAVVARFPVRAWPGPIETSPDGAFVADLDVRWADSNRAAHVWDVAAGTMASIPRGAMPGDARCVAIAAGGRVCAFGTGGGRVHLVAVAPPHASAVLEGHLGRVARVAFSRDGRYVLSVGTDANVIVWDAARALASAAR